MAIRRCTCDLVAIHKVVSALNGVAELYRAAACGELRLADAIASKKLVLVEAPRIAYWEGKSLEANWERRTKRWELLWELASSAKRKLPVDRENLSNRKSERAIRDRRSDLSKDLPYQLDALIVPAGRYCYRLNLPPAEIALFIHDGDTELVEELSVGALQLPR